jgi:hypothetical protein
MKDLLGRDIMVGDTLASAAAIADIRYAVASLKLSKVLAVAEFAVQAVDISTDPNPEVADATPPFVLDDTQKYVICDWAKGASAA